jgi:hypothetical protein
MMMSSLTLQSMMNLKTTEKMMMKKKGLRKWLS